MTQQRIPVLLCFLLPAALGCAGKGGEPIDAIDPNAPPVVSDKQPPGTNQNPVSPVGVAPVANQNPASGAGTPAPPEPPGGGGACREICEGLPARGCATPEEGCDAACRPDPEDVCPRETLELLVCGSEVVCPDEIQAQAQQVMAHCPSQYAAFTTCLLNTAGTD